MDYRKVKESSFKLASLSADKRNAALRAIKDALVNQKDRIIQSNKADLERAKIENIAQPLYKRLKFDEDKLAEVVGGIESLIELTA